MVAVLRISFLEYNTLSKLKVKCEFLIRTKMNKEIFSIIILAVFMILTNHLHTTGMHDYTFDNDGGGIGSAGDSIDGGLSAILLPPQDMCSRS
jgi:hypothetical protein